MPYRTSNDWCRRDIGHRIYWSHAHHRLTCCIDMGVDSTVTSDLISLSSDYRLFCSLKHSKLYKEWPWPPIIMVVQKTSTDDNHVNKQQKEGDAAPWRGSRAYLQILLRRRPGKCSWQQSGTIQNYDNSSKYLYAL